MGVIKHNAIIVTSWDEERINKIHKKCEKFIKKGMKDYITYFPETLCIITHVIKSIANGYYSFIIGPDGSKEGWETSNSMDEVRNKIVKYLNKKKVDYAHITYGGDFNDKTIE